MGGVSGRTALYGAMLWGTFAVAALTWSTTPRPAAPPAASARLPPTSFAIVELVDDDEPDTGTGEQPGGQPGRQPEQHCARACLDARAAVDRAVQASADWA